METLLNIELHLTSYAHLSIIVVMAMTLNLAFASVIDPSLSFS